MGAAAKATPNRSARGARIASLISLPGKPVDGRIWLPYLAFAVAYAVFLAIPAFLHGSFPLERLMEWGDVIDLATPLVVLGLLWWLIRTTVGPLSGRLTVLFALLALLWTEGHAMHLAANSIGHHVASGAGGPLPAVIDLYDERLSHYIWYFAALSVPLFLLYALGRARAPAHGRADLGVVLAALIYGVALALTSIEAAVIPLALALLLGTLLYAASARGFRRAAARTPLFAFSVTAVVAALAVIAVWGAYYGGWPELSDVGLI